MAKLERCPSDVSELETGTSYSSDEQTTFLIENVEKLRMAAGYSDLTINVEGRTFPCHKVILASGSPYFRSMFASGMEESWKDNIDIRQIESDVFDYVLHFIYTGNVHVTESIAQELFTQAHLFQISPLVELCVKFLEENMNRGNCLAIMTLAEAHAHKNLYNYGKEYACKNFITLSQDEDFYKLSTECIVDLLKDRRLNCSREETVYDAAAKWLEYDVERRAKQRFKIFECVKFPLIERSFLMDVVAKSPHVSGDDRGSELLEDAIMYHTVPSRRNMLPSYQITPRYSFPYFETAILLGGRLVDGLSNEVECYCPLTGEFSSLKQLPFKKRNEFAVCVIGDEIYVSGGLRSAEFWKYDSTFETWLRGANLTHARRRHAMAAVDGSIYVLGGFDEDNVLGSVEMWHPDRNKWQETGRLSEAVENMGYASYGKKIYLFGGKNCIEVVVNAVQSYDTTTNTCVALSKSLPANDMCLTATVMNNHVYIVGLEGVFCFSPDSEQWNSLPDMSCPRDFVSLAVLDEKLYAFGGRRRGAKDNLYTDVIECYDPEKCCWKVVGSIPIAMYSYGCVRILLTCREKQNVLDESLIAALY